jgi:hypothetical protein
MSENTQFKIGGFGRRMIFAGPFIADITIIDYIVVRFDHKYHLHDTTLICIVFAVIASNLLASIYFYKRLSKRSVILIGICGWMLTFILQFLRGWFG